MLSFRARLFLAFALLWLLFLGGAWYLAGRSVDQALKRRPRPPSPRTPSGRPRPTGRARRAPSSPRAGFTCTSTPKTAPPRPHPARPPPPPERLRRAGPTPEVLWEEGFAAALVATPLGLLVLTAETSPIEAALGPSGKPSSAPSSSSSPWAWLWSTSRPASPPGPWRPWPGRSRAEAQTAWTPCPTACPRTSSGAWWRR